NYDSSDNLISLIDAESNTTIFEYDKNNRLVKEIRPMGQETNYTYDSLGNLVSKTDAKNQKTQYIYNDIGRLTDIKYYKVSTDTAPEKTVTFTYNKTGNLTAYNDGTTQGTYIYNTLGQKVSEAVNFGMFTKTNTYSYFKNGLKKTFTGPDSITYGYLYNANQLTGIQIPDKGFITINEYKWNRPKSMTLPGGATKTYEYDPLMRTTSIISKDPGDNTLLNYNYTFDNMDNITTKSTDHGDYAYDYDDLYRLTATDNPDVQVPSLNDEAFTYDNVGNRLTSTETTNPWGYNNNNELSGYDDTNYEYDSNGNMIKKTVAGTITTYVYNTEDRLTQVWDGEPATGTLTVEYYYDPFGRRLYKDVSGIRIYFHYADEGLIAEFGATGAEIKSYGYKPNSTWTSDPLFMKVGEEYYFYQNDHLGTPQKMTAGNGEVVWSAKYNSFGEAMIEIETVENNLRFPGQYEDGETGLHYNYWRYYDVKAGRYIKTDPIGISGGTNSFLYSNQNPITVVDPFGLICNIEKMPGVGSMVGESWFESQKVGYYGALISKIAWEIFKIRMKVLPIPITKIEEKQSMFKYRVRYTQYERYLVVTHYFYVCYDDCTKEEISREYNGYTPSSNTQKVIVGAYEVDKYIGIPDKEFNRNDDVDPLIIRGY
ncbi:MAG: RHS domain-containing protein, partial [Desulfobacteraceae bacterium]|nr:RHS domain-containing protein [Desulfobacteraceae bacterium]